MAPAMSGFQGLAFLRGGVIAAAPRAAMASWHLRVSKAPSAVAGDFLIERNLVKQFGQHGRVAHVAGGELGGPDFQGSLVDPDVDLAPDLTFGAAMLARVPLPLTLDLDASAVDQQVRRTVRSTMGNVHFQVLLATRQGAEVRHGRFRPINRRRLSTNPVVCRSAMPNRTFIVRQVWIAASL